MEQESVDGWSLVNGQGEKYLIENILSAYTSKIMINSGM